MKNLKSYHFAWLSIHPARTPEWLSARLADGFHVHHLDLDHSNDDPKNLVLIECVDHFRLHGLDHIQMTAERARTLASERWSKVAADERSKIMTRLTNERWKKHRRRKRAEWEARQSDPDARKAFKKKEREKEKLRKARNVAKTARYRERRAAARDISAQA